MTKVIAVAHARLSSSRLPGKVLKTICGHSVLYHHIERLRQCPEIDEIWLGTTKSPNNAPLIEEAKKIGIPYYAGAEEDVVERYLEIGRRTNADVFVRCGCDKPLFSYEVVNTLLDEYTNEDVMSSSTPLGRGIASELLSMSCIERIYEHYHGPAITKHVYEYPHLYRTRAVPIDDELSRPEFRLTLDTEEDFDLIKKLYSLFYEPGQPVDLREVYKYLDDNPELANINRFVEEKQVNSYVKELAAQPALTLHLCPDGHYLVKDRLGQLVPKNELLNILDLVIDPKDLES